jgi:hypothetical protein
MQTLPKILVVILLLSITFVIVIQVAQNPAEVTRTSLIESLIGTSEKGQNEVCCQKCETPNELPDECKQLDGFSCNSCP